MKGGMAPTLLGFTTALVWLPMLIVDRIHKDLTPLVFCDPFGLLTPLAFGGLRGLFIPFGHEIATSSSIDPLLSVRVGA
jgi:hypothetical protein